MRKLLSQMRHTTVVDMAASVCASICISLAQLASPDSSGHPARALVLGLWRARITTSTRREGTLVVLRQRTAGQWVLEARTRLTGRPWSRLSNVHIVADTVSTLDWFNPSLSLPELITRRYTGADLRDAKPVGAQEDAPNASQSITVESDPWPSR
ncbi:hypothetical protein GGI08_001686 [Coemansia sp. S2]|nr:hypothetical protein GGI08_001686 [Coemansia sp. S2]